MRTVTKLTDNKFVNVYNVVDPEHNVGGYQFAERLGVDSIAFICFDPISGQYLLNKEYTPPTNEFHLRAFGGSLDSSSDPLVIVKNELMEEAGFENYVSIIPMGKVFVSTQMNQYCHLFLCIVKKGDQGERHPENAIEAMAQPQWVDEATVNSGSDWKAISIVAKFHSN